MHLRLHLAWRCLYDSAILGALRVLPGRCAHGKSGTSSLGISATVSIPVQSIDAVRKRADWNDAGIVIFPQLRIYDDRRRLHYSSYDSGTIQQIFPHFPEDMAMRSASVNAPSLSTVLSAIPEFHQYEPAILNYSRFTVISVSMDGCHGRSLQDKTLSSRQSQLLTAGVNLLTLQVNHQ
jgi:hypothetical protein